MNGEGHGLPGDRMFLALRLVRGWIALYTLGLPKAAKGERRAEINADIWEQTATRAAGPRGLAVLLRCLRGVPDDLLWRVGEARRDRIAQGRNQLMETFMAQPRSSLVHRGKVRDTYDIGDGRLLMIATDRISAFDVVMPNPVPGKGLILAQMSAFWFNLTGQAVRNHFIGMASDRAAISGVPVRGALAELPPDMTHRAMVIRRAKRIDMECVVRAYLAGSAWAEYRSSGTINGARMPAGLSESDRLPELMFTPSTKAQAGHDEPMTWDEAVDLVGEETARRLRDLSFKVFQIADRHATARGMIIADTKFEFGWIDGQLILIDEILTPDSSRFWDAKNYRPGVTQPAFDKQFVRDWLLSSGWNRQPPAPVLPDDVVARTRERYEQALERLTGRRLET